MKIETKVRKCYLVECVIDNIDTYYKSEIVFTCRDDANALKEKMKKEAEEFLSKKEEHIKKDVLDKIRAEIETIIGERNLDDYDFCSGLICARKILDKYKTESEELKTIQEKQAESEKYQKAFDDGYENEYAQAKFDYEPQPICEVEKMTNEEMVTKLETLESKITELENNIAELNNYINDAMRYDYLRRDELAIVNLEPGDYMTDVVTMNW